MSLTIFKIYFFSFKNRIKKCKILLFEYVYNIAYILALDRAEIMVIKVQYVCRQSLLFWTWFKSVELRQKIRIFVSGYFNIPWPILQPFHFQITQNIFSLYFDLYAMKKLVWKKTKNFLKTYHSFSSQFRAPNVSVVKDGIG
jgi:hypothetical protein